MNRWKFRRNTSRLILVLASLVTLIAIVMTGVSSYAATPDAAYIHKIEGTGLVIGVGNNPNRTRAKEHQQLNVPNQVLYVPGGNKSFAYLGFIFDWVQEHADLLVSAGPSPNPSEWSFPCSAKGVLKIAWKKGQKRGCEEGVKVQSSSKRSVLPNNNIQASRRLLAQAEDEVTVVPTPGQSIIQTADSAAGITIDVLVGDVRVKSAKNPGGRLVKAGERYNYPQDTITPIDINPIVNSPEMQDFLNPNNWRSPDIPQRVADGFSEQLGEMRTALGKGSPAIASNSGNNNPSQSPLSQLPQRTASQSTQPQQTTSSQQSSDLNGTWTAKSDPFYTADREPGCHPGSIGGTSPLPGANEFTIVQSRDGSISIPGNFSGWSSTNGSRGYGSTAGGRVSGNVFTLRAIVGGFTNEYKGTISNDSNTITGRVVCSHSSGSATAEGSFTMTRQGSQASAQTNYCNSRTVTQPTFSSNSHDGTPYRIWMDFSRGQEVSSAVCGRQYWVKEDANHPNYQIRFVYLVDGKGKCVVPYLYKETDGGTLEVVRQAPECSSGS